MSMSTVRVCRERLQHRALQVLIVSDTQLLCTRPQPATSCKGSTGRPVAALVAVRDDQDEPDTARWFH